MIVLRDEKGGRGEGERESNGVLIVNDAELNIHYTSHNGVHVDVFHLVFQVGIGSCFE